MQMFEMGGVYICASVGAAEIIEEFKAIGLTDEDISRIQFVDLVSSGILGGTDVPTRTSILSTAQLCSSPFLLRTLYILRMTTAARNFVFLDSVNALQSTTMIECLLNTFTPSSTPSGREKFCL